MTEGGGGRVIRNGAIESLGPDDVFVFGSNLAGRHGKGAALLARQRFGAEYGRGEGLMGQSYALPTKDAALRPLPLERIGAGLAELGRTAAEMPEKQFLLTRVGQGLAGYGEEDISRLVAQQKLPANVLPWTSWEKAPSQAAAGEELARRFGLFIPDSTGNKGLRGPYSSFEIVKAPFRGADPVKHGFDVWGMRGDRGETMEQVRPGEKGWLGNPHKAIEVGGPFTREEAVSRFNRDFLKRVAEDPDYRQAVLDLKGKRVAYYAPKEEFIHLHPIQQWLSEQPDAAPQLAVSPSPGPSRQRSAGSSEFAGGLQLVLPIVGIGTGVGAAAYALASLYQGQQRQQ